MLPVTIVPSLPASSLAEIAQLCTALRGVAQGVQIDIVDGVYVPHTSWPFTETEGMDIFADMETYTKDYLLEVDCMVQAPEQYLDRIAALSPERVCIHAGSTKAYTDIIVHAQTNGYRLGLAFTNDTPLSALYEHHDDVSYVQLMGIAKVGQQGQPFDERTLQRARALRAEFPDLEIAVDGSVNATTMPALFAAGVNRFAPGSAIAKQADPAAAYKQLCALVR